MNSSVIPVKKSANPQSIFEDNSPRLESQENSSFSIKNHKRKYVFKIYDNFVEFTPPPVSSTPFPRKHSTRSTIKTFSSRSRFRLFSLLAKIDRIHTRNALFVTLTYHNNYTDFDRKGQVDFHNFLTQYRNYDPGVQYIWRIELQKRGAPHFHLIIFPGLKYNPKKVSKYKRHFNLLWHNVADKDSSSHLKYGCDFVKIHNYRKACAYLSKYIAKVADCGTNDVHGKHWGNSRNLPTVCLNEFTCIRPMAQEIIKRLRLWLLEKGKNNYESDKFFNIHRPQSIFISIDEFEQLRKGIGKVVNFDSYDAFSFF